MNCFDLKENAKVTVEINSTNSLASFIWILKVTYFTFEREHLILSASLRAKSNNKINVVFATTFPCSRSYEANNAHYNHIMGQFMEIYYMLST